MRSVPAQEARSIEDWEHVVRMTKAELMAAIKTDEIMVIRSETPIVVAAQPSAGPFLRLHSP